MKKYLKRFAELFLTALPHINIAMSIVMLTLWVTDRFNRAMAFLNNNLTKGMLFVWCFLIIIQSVEAIVRHRRR